MCGGTKGPCPRLPLCKALIERPVMSNRYRPGSESESMSSSPSSSSSSDEEDQLVAGLEQGSLAWPALHPALLFTETSQRKARWHPEEDKQLLRCWVRYIESSRILHVGEGCELDWCIMSASRVHHFTQMTLALVPTITPCVVQVLGGQWPG